MGSSSFLTRSNTTRTESTSAGTRFTISSVNLRRKKLTSVVNIWRMGLLVQIGLGYHVLVSDQPSSDAGAASPGRPHGCGQNYVFQFHKLQRFPVVPALVVEVLAQEFDGGLGSVFLLFGHVQVVHKNDAALSNRRTVDSAAALIEFAVDCVLALVRTGLGRLGHGNLLVVLG